MDVSSSDNPAHGVIIRPERMLNNEIWPPPVQYQNGEYQPYNENLVTDSIQLDYAIGKVIGFIFVPLICKCMFTFALMFLSRLTIFNDLADAVNKYLPFCLVFISMAFSYYFYRSFKKYAPQLAKGFRIGVVLMSIIYITSFIIRSFTGS